MATSSDDESGTRVELARWFLDRDQVDEAAATLAAGDELELGTSDALNLKAALARHGLAASYERRRLSVGAADPAALVSSPRKPPGRVPPAAAPAAKKTA